MDIQDYTITPGIKFKHLRSVHDGSLDRALLSQGLQRANLSPHYENLENFPVNPQLNEDCLENTVTNSIDSPELIPTDSPIDLRNILSLGGDYVASRVELPELTDCSSIVRIDYVNFEGGNIHTVHVVLPTEEFPGNGYFISPTGPGTPENPGEKLRSKYFKRESK